MSENNLNESGGIIEIPESIPGGIVEMREEGKPRLEEEQKRIAEAWKTIEEKQEDIENEYRKIVEERKKIEEEQIRITEEQGKLEREKRKIKSERSDLSWVRRRMKEEREHKEKEERERREKEERERREKEERERREQYDDACKILDDPNSVSGYSYNYKTFSELGERFAKLGDYKDSIIKQRICVETVAAIEGYHRRGKVWFIVTVLLITALVVFHLLVPLPIGWMKYLMYAGEMLVMGILFGVLVETLSETDLALVIVLLVLLPLIYSLFYAFYLFPSAELQEGSGWLKVIVCSLLGTLVGVGIFIAVSIPISDYYAHAKRRICKKIKRKYTT